MRCSKTERYGEMRNSGEAFIARYAAKPWPDYEAEEIDDELNPFQDICLNCRTREAHNLFFILVERHNKRFLRKHKSPYFLTVGMKVPLCTGYRPDKLPVRKTDK
jgi:hypothetical protein